MQPALRFLFRWIAGILSEEIADGRFEDRRDRNFSCARCPLQFRLQFARQAPAIDFSFHALQCSAIGDAL